MTDSLALDRLGLRFLDLQTEAAYRRYRLDVSVPWTRTGLAAAVVAWVSALGFVAAGMPALLAPVAAWIALGVLPLLCISLTFAFVRALLPGMVPVTATVTSLTGLIAVWLSYGVVGNPGGAAGSCIMPLFVAFTIFRQPPLVASTAVLPFVVFLLALLWRDYDAGILDRVEFAIYSYIPVTSFMIGLLCNVMIELLTRQAYRDRRIIEQQRQALTEERAQLSRFLSPEVTRMVRERGIEATLTQQTLDLTVVYCDLRGFTAYTQRHGPVEMARVLRDYYGLVIDVAKRYGGTVKDFAGDGALILLGAPVPRTDHATAGVALARDVVRAVQTLTAPTRSEAVPLGIGAGVATGPCAVGAIGSQTRLEYTAVGPAVNLAARLCSQSGDGEVLICPVTAAAVPGPGRRIEEMHLKGIDRPLPVAVETVS